jgi:hypothetical protein
MRILTIIVLVFALAHDMPCSATIVGPDDGWLVVSDEASEMGELWIDQEFVIATDTWVKLAEMR